MTGRHVETHVIVTVVRPHIGCPWSIEAGTAPIEAHNAFIEHLDVHDPDYIARDDCDQEDGEEVARSDEAVDELAAVCGLYAGDTAEQIAAEQARVDRFMAGGEDR